MRECMDSILAQEFRDFELFVSDNCSTDETPDILAKYAKQDSRVRVSRSNEFLHVVDNINRAVALCSGEWVKLFCHDDIMHITCLSSLRKAIERADAASVGLIGNGEAWLFANGYYYASPAAYNDAEIKFWQGTDLIGNIVRGTAEIGVPALNTATVRKRAWEDAGKFDGRFDHCDTFLWMRLLMKWNYLFVPEVLTTNRIHGSQGAASARKSLKSVADYRVFWSEFIKEYGSQLKLDARARLKSNLKPLAAAGTSIATEVILGDVKRALNIFFEMPAAWWPVLPAFVARSLRNERRRILPFRPHVPVRMIYP